MKLPPKPSLAEFIETCTPLAIIPSLEAEMRERVTQITSSLLAYEAQDDPVVNLARFLRADRDFLGITLSLANLSQEKFLRILSTERFANADYGKEWGIKTIHNKLAREADFAYRIAQLVSEGKHSPLLSQQVAAFYLDQLSLPANWQGLIRDPDYMQNVIRRKLTGEYTDKKGDAVEGIIRRQLDQIAARYGVEHSKGQVRMLGKEVDHLVPPIEEPWVMIMTSYLETTSSTQTVRANEQSEMYGKVQADNRRHGTNRAFVNFVDGAGWLARRSDLRKLYDGCDYIINLKTLDRLDAIICKHVPASYFRGQARPSVED